MDWQEALEIIVARRKNERYRILCDESHSEHKLHRASVIRQVTGENPVIVPDRPTHTVLGGTGGSLVKISCEESFKLTQEIKACPHNHKDPPCGCSGSRCRIGKMGRPDPPHEGTIVQFFDCWSCLYPNDERPLPHITKVF